MKYGGGWAVKNYFLSTSFQWLTPELLEKFEVAQKNLVAHPQHKINYVHRYVSKIGLLH